jgi:hypothetical protein
MLKHLIVITSLALAPCLLLGAESNVDFVEQISALTTARHGLPMKLKPGEAATTKATFKPPVEIVIEAKISSSKSKLTNLRMSYAADQVIFNWEGAPELRVDGGPANGRHKKGAGIIPMDKYVSIRWLVTPTKQSIYVENELRFEHSGDYSSIDNPVSIFGVGGSEISVKSIKVKQLPPGT